MIPEKEVDVRAGWGGVRPGAMNLYLDRCCHCACITYFSGYKKLENVIEDLEAGITGCDLCIEDSEGDGHTRCAILYLDDKPVWDGRCLVNSKLE